MKQKIVYILILFITTMNVEAVAQKYSSKGKDFWFSAPNISFGHSQNNSSYTLEYKAYIVATRGCQVVFSNDYTGWSDTLSMQSGGIAILWTLDYESLCDTASGEVVQRAIHVTSTDTITLYLAIQRENVMDATNILPTYALGSDYWAQCYPSKNSQTASSVISVTATQDSTIIDIYPSVETANGFHPGEHYTALLQKGESYQLASAPSSNGDLSGTHITARDRKKIALFSGHTNTYAPVGQFSASPIFDQALPSDYGGQEYVIRNTSDQCPDRVRIIALSDNTQITNERDSITTLSAGEVFEMTPTANKTLHLYSSHPICVGIVLPSKDGPGTPSLLYVPPVSYYSLKSTFYSKSSDISHTHYLNLVVPTAEIDSISIDGHPVVQHTTFLPTADSSYSVARMRINDELHTIKTTGSHGFIAYAYGFSSKQSYCYMAGMSYIRPFDEWLYLDNALIDTITPISRCDDEPFLLFPSTTYPIDSVLWYADSTFLIKSDTITGRNLPYGHYQLTAQIYTTTPYDDSLVVRSISIPLEWGHAYSTSHTDSILTSQLPWQFEYKTYYQEVDSDTIKYVTLQGCDSLIIYTLHVYDTSHPQPIDTTTCMYYAPNCFTPNASTNNTFQIVSTEIKQFEIFIFHRNGTQIFHTKDLNAAWDGTYNGSPCPQGVYVYQIRYTFKIAPKSWHVRNGTITLIR